MAGLVTLVIFGWRESAPRIAKGEIAWSLTESIVSASGQYFVWFERGIEKLNFDDLGVRGNAAV